MSRFIIAIMAVILTVSLLTFLLGKVTRQWVYMKYTSSFLFLLSGIYNFYKARTVHNGFEDLASFLVAILFLAGFLSSVVTGLITDLFLPRIRK